MVIMDRQDYINKANSLLNQNAYRSISQNPTNTIKNKLFSILKRVTNQTGLDSLTFKSMYPTACVPPKFYSLPNIHQPDTPLRPIVSRCGSVTYGVDKELAKIPKPLVGKSPHHINSTQDFAEQVNHIILGPGECLSSYDVSALFTSVPVDPALNIIKDLLEKDYTLKERTVLAVSDIILLLEFCLKNTYFSFQGQFYEQVEGAAMGYPVSPIVPNMYMEYLEHKAISIAPHPLCSGAGLWMTPLSYTRRSTNKTSFNTSTVLTMPSGLQCRTTMKMVPSPSWTPLSNIRLMVAYPLLCTGNPHIQTSTCSEVVTITSQPSLVSSILSLIGPKQCAASMSYSNKKGITSGRLSLNANILNGLWTRWRKDITSLLVRSLMGLITKPLQLPKLSPAKFKLRATLSYPTQGLCESIKKICGRYGIQTHFKSGSSIKNLLMSHKDKDPLVKQSGAIYWYQCGDLGCNDEYIGETSRTFGERYKEYLKAPSPIHHHSNQTGHPTSHNNFQIIGREGHNLARNIKESIFIRVNNPTLNNNIGKFNLPHIWDRVLLNTQGIKLKRQVNNNNIQSN